MATTFIWVDSSNNNNNKRAYYCFGIYIMCVCIDKYYHNFNQTDYSKIYFISVLS